MLNLIINELRLQLFELRQYWFETVLSIAAVTGIFVALFYGIKIIMVPEADGSSQTLENLLFGYIIWTFASGVYSSAICSIADDSKKGILEQLFLCPFGFRRLMLARVLSGLLILMVTMGVLAYLAMALTSTWIDINFFYLYCVLSLGAPALVGLGFCVAGFALIFKRVETLASLLNIGLIGIIALEGLPPSWNSLFPYTPTVSLAKSLMWSDTAIGWTDMLVVVGNSAAYFLVGMMIFSACERFAKDKNLIGMH